MADHWTARVEGGSVATLLVFSRAGPYRSLIPCQELLFENRSRPNKSVWEACAAHALMLYIVLFERETPLLLDHPLLRRLDSKPDRPGHALDRPRVQRSGPSWRASCAREDRGQESVRRSRGLAIVHGSARRRYQPVQKGRTHEWRATAACPSTKKRTPFLCRERDNDAHYSRRARLA